MFLRVVRVFLLWRVAKMDFPLSAIRHEVSIELRGTIQRLFVQRFLLAGAFNAGLNRAARAMDYA